MPGEYGFPPGENSYILERSTVADFSQGYARFTPAQNATQYSDSSVSPGTTYYYRLRAVGSYGWTAPCASVSATTPGEGGEAPDGRNSGSGIAGNCDRDQRRS